jgi:hypothetical protein
MAETTTRPARSRKATPAKATTPSAVTTAASESAAAEEPSAAVTGAPVKLVLEPHPGGHTKSYTKFVAPDGSGCTGTFYAPLGVTEVRVLLISG